MHICASKRSRDFYLSALLALGLIGVACQPAANTTGNANTANANANTSPVANTNTTTDTGPTINAREPEKYQATLVLTAQTSGGERAQAIPPLSAEVAHSGADQRVAFKLPNGEQLIWLDRADKHYVIAPGRKQYAELTPQATGFQMGRLMSPGQIVAYLSKQRGYTKVGEEQRDGRMADKYAYAATAKTNSQAGDVKTQTYVYIDKETGLPLRSELFSEASGSVQGVKGVTVVVEMRDIKTDVESSLFEVPQGLEKVSEQQVRQQVDALTSAMTAIVGGMLQNMNAPGGSTTTTTTTTTTASPTASPAATAKP